MLDIRPKILHFLGVPQKWTGNRNLNMVLGQETKRLKSHDSTDQQNDAQSSGIACSREVSGQANGQAYF